MLSTDEIQEFKESDLEDIIMRKPNLLEENLTFVRRQHEILPSSRIDLLFTDENGDYVVVELKLGSVGREASNQIRRYIHEIRASERKRVRGIIVCKDVFPAFRDLYKKLTDVKVHYYGWKPDVQLFRLNEAD